MSKFKMGQRIKYNEGDGIQDGVFVKKHNDKQFIIETSDKIGWNRDSDIPRKYKSQYHDCYWFVNEFELISEPHYTKINPKVGEKYRVVKNIPGVGFNPGDKIEYAHETSFVRIPGGMSQWIIEGQLTTEFLELITEPEKIYIDAKDLNAGVITYSSSYNPTGMTEPINKSIIKKSMSFIKRLTQSSDDKALLKARFTDDCGNLTSRGQEALTSLVFAEKKAELVKLAEEVIAEEKE